MTPVISANQAISLPRAGTSSFPEAPQTVGSSPAQFDQTYVDVLTFIGDRGQPLTAGQIGRALRLPTADVQSITQTLCELHLLRRLNTIIESYIAAPPALAESARTSRG